MIDGTSALTHRARSPIESAVEKIRARRTVASTILRRKSERAVANDRNVASKSRLTAIFAKACAQLQIGL
jgi:hypothetical protein